VGIPPLRTFEQSSGANGDRYAVELDPTYLWFADKESNPAYRRPDYFICATPPIMWSMNQVVRAQAGLSSAVYGCWQNVLVRIAGRFCEGCGHA
jgi:hypothetical protein